MICIVCCGIINDILILVRIRYVCPRIASVHILRSFEFTHIIVIVLSMSR